MTITISTTLLDEFQTQMELDMAGSVAADKPYYYAIIKKINDLDLDDPLLKVELDRFLENSVYAQQNRPGFLRG